METKIKQNVSWNHIQCLVKGFFKAILGNIHWIIIIFSMF